ncbi:PKD-like domain-containing protein [Pontibacter saemangeumensis]
MQKNFTKLIAHFLSTKRYTVPAGAFLLFLATSLYVWATIFPAPVDRSATVDQAANGASPAFVSIGNVVINEEGGKDFDTNSFVIRTNGNWRFDPSSATTVALSSSGGNIVSGRIIRPSVSSDNKTLTFGITYDNNGNSNETITISGIQVQPISGAVALPSAGTVFIETNNKVLGLGSDRTVANLTMTHGAARKLAFVTQPSTVETGSAITPAPQVVIQDQFNNTVTNATNTVTLTRAANASLTGALTPGTATISNGIVTFTGASINAAGVGYQLVASSSGLTAATSTAFTVNNKQPVISAVSGCLSIGDPDTEVIITGQNFVSGAAVTFGGVAASSVTVNSATTITAVIPSSAFTTSGSKSVIVTNPLPASSNGVSAAFAKSVTALFSRPINGPNSICGSTSNSTAFTIETGPNIDSYLWTIVSGDASIASGETSGNPRINFGEPGEVELSVVSYNVCGKPSPAVTKTITVNARPDVLLSASKIAICAGETVQLSASGADSYVWSGTGVAAGTTGSSIDVTPTTTTTYTLTGSNAYTSGTTTINCPTTRTVTITVTPALSQGAITAGNTQLCQNGASTTLTATVSGGGTATRSFIWEESVTGDEGAWSQVATSATYSPSTATAGTIYYRRTVSAGACTVVSNPIAITVTPAIEDNTINTQDQNVCSGFDIALLDGATAVAGSQEVTYVWEQSSTGNGNWTPAVGANGNTGEDLQPEARTVTSASTTFYRRKVTSGNCESYSNIVSVKVNPAPTATITQGQFTYFCSPGTALLSAAEVAGASYKWFRAESGGPVEVADTRITNVGVVGTYYVVVKYDNTTCESTSATISVQETVVGNNIVGIDNGNQEVCYNAVPAEIVGSEATSSVGPITYQWEVSEDNVTFTILKDATGLNLSQAQLGAHTADRWYRRIARVGSCTNVSPQTVHISVKPELLLTSASGATVVETICSGTTFSYTPASNAPAGSTYSWSRAAVSGISNAPASGVGAISEELVNTTSMPLQVTYVYRITTPDNCESALQYVNVRVNPSPVLNNTTTEVAVCSNAPFTYTATTATTSLPAPTFGWTRAAVAGIANAAASGTGATINETLVNTTSAPVEVTYLYTITSNGCAGSEQSVMVTVNPTPTVNTIANASYCNGAAGAAIVFGGPVSGATYSWTSSANVGFGLSGTGNIGAFTATNTTAAPVVATVTVTPSANGCPGTPRTFTVTVNPTPTVNTIASRTLCNGASGAAISFGSPVAGTTYSWTSSANVGFGLSGTGNIGAFTATNTTAAPVVATVTVTPSANGCPGTPQTFTVTVNPTPTVNTIASRTLCNGASGAAISFGSPVAGTTYSWTSSANVGFGLSGTGNIGAFTATNTTAAPVVATVTVTPSANGCPGTPRTFTVTVNPNQPVAFTGVIASTNTFYTGQSSVALTALPTGGVFSSSKSGAVTLSNGIYSFNPCTAGPGTHTITYTRTTGSCTSTVSKTVTVVPSTYTVVVTTNNFPVCRGENTDYTAQVYRDIEGVIYPYMTNAQGQPLNAQGQVVADDEDPAPNPDYINNPAYVPANTPAIIKQQAYRFFEAKVILGNGAKVNENDGQDSKVNSFTYGWTRSKSDGSSISNDARTRGFAGLSATDWVAVWVSPKNPGTTTCSANFNILSSRIYFSEPRGYTMTLSPVAPWCYNPTDQSNVTLTANLGALSVGWDATNVRVDWYIKRSGVADILLRTTTGASGSTISIEEPRSKFQNGDQVYLNYSSAFDTFADADSKCTKKQNLTTPITITIDQPADITAALAAPAAMCEAGSVTMSVNATGTNLQYAWYKAGSATQLVNSTGKISGATTNAITIANLATTDAGNYYVTVSNAASSACGATETSNEVTLVVNPLTRITAQPIAQTLCVGQGASFNVAATGTNVAYQWLKGGNIISGATSATYSIPAVTTADAGIYSVSVTGTCGTLTSDAVALNVNTPPAITAQPLAQNVCAGTGATFNVTATGTDIAYQWLKGGIVIPGATANSYTIPSATEADEANYSVRITGTSACGSITSEAVALTVNPIATIIATMEVNPDPVMVNESATFTAFTDIKDGVQVVYEWYIGDEETGAWRLAATNTVTSNTNSFTIESVEEGAFNARVDIKPMNDGTNCYNATSVVTGEITPLPVEIIYLNASKQGNNVLLEWATAMEQDNAGFEVQVSTDGFTYRKLTFVPAKNGNASTRQEYAFTDKENGKFGTRYYRLKQLDTNGTHEYFGPKAVSFGSVASQVIAFPNPFHDEVTLDIASETAGEALITVTDAVGKQLLVRRVQVEKGFTTEKLRLDAGLPRGLYIIKAQVGGVTQYIKMIKE